MSESSPEPGAQPIATGRVDLVGAGPGDPGLITRRGAAILARADVVVYDHLVHPRLLDLAPRHALLVDVGKATGRHYRHHQDAIHQILIDHARAGKAVARLKGGDPFVFGRGGEEAQVLRQAGIPFAIVPGVTAGVGATAYAGVPITHRADASAVAFVTGHDDPASSRLDWSALARFPGTLVIYMGMSRLPRLTQTLIDQGKPADTPALVTQWGSLPRQRVLTATLGSIAGQAEAAGLGPPALLVVGDVVRHRQALNWFEELPLFGRSILITRPIGDTEDSAATLEALGAEVLTAPTVEILPLDRDQSLSLDRTLAEIESFDWIVFTSANGVRAMVDHLERLGKDLRALGQARLAAIGPGTADALKAFHLRPDLVPDRFDSDALAEALAPEVANRSVLLARADRGRDVLRERLKPLARRVEQAAVYRNADAASLPANVLERLSDGTVDWITLTSSAITRRLHTLLPHTVRSAIGGRVKLASISPITSETARGLGWTVHAEARDFTWNGLIQAILEVEAKPRRDTETDGSTPERDS